MCYFYFLMAMNACCNPPPPILAFLYIMNSFDMIQELVKGLKRLLKRKTVHWLKNGRRALSITSSGLSHQLMMISLTSKKLSGFL